MCSLKHLYGHFERRAADQSQDPALKQTPKVPGRQLVAKVGP